MNERTIFMAAMEFSDVNERAAYLDEACEGDTELRRQVEDLLRNHAAAGSFLDKPAGHAATMAMPPVTEQPGTVIGPYKLLEQIGEGGFGVVYRGEQRAPVRRQVALKIIKPGMDTREVIARFEAERQALALMDHSNIARVLDAGATESGRPYFVMELVKGVPITEYCDQCNLTTRERLELFVSVCQAVQHAHQKGIIHRDIKPSNVLIAIQDGQPAAKVIDFGVAKAINQRLTEQTLQTGFAQMLGTPLYMSPEQAEMSALDVDTRSDIYSLGVLLYELLTGTTPLERERLSDVSFDELRRIIREEEPPRPSARISTLAADLADTVAEHRRSDPRRLSRQVRGELDWIVMKALEKDRTRRYESASALAADVQWYLSDEPVHACPPSVWYSLHKFSRRNKGRLAFAATILFFLVVLGGGGGWVIRDREAREQEVARERAARQARVAIQVDVVVREVDRLMKQQQWPEALASARRAQAALASGDADQEAQQRLRQVLADLKLVAGLEEARLLKSEWTKDSFDYTRADRAYAAAFGEYGVDVENMPAQEAAAMLSLRKHITVPLAVGLDNWADTKRRLPKLDESRWKTLVAVAQLIDPDAVRSRLRALWGKRVTEDIRSQLMSMAEAPRLDDQPPATFDLLARTLNQVGVLGG